MKIKRFLSCVSGDWCPGHIGGADCAAREAAVPLFLQWREGGGLGIRCGHGSQATRIRKFVSWFWLLSFGFHVPGPKLPQISGAFCPLADFQVTTMGHHGPSRPSIAFLSLLPGFDLQDQLPTLREAPPPPPTVSWKTKIRPSCQVWLGDSGLCLSRDQLRALHRRCRVLNGEWFLGHLNAWQT